jgi:all-trans-retinol 13,14-reductase
MQQDQYDVVIIGSGLGGLLCAVMLAKEGMQVCVLEKNRQIGGCLQTFALQKKVFDSCVHYMGGLSEGHTLHSIFSYAGIIEDLRLHELDPHGFDRIAFGSEEPLYPQANRQHFVESLAAYFPEETVAIRKYLDLVEDVASRFPLYNLHPGNADSKGAVTGLELAATLRSLTSNERLVQVLAGNNLLYAGVEGQTPFYVHAMALDSYLHSAHKVIPGSSQISKLLWKRLSRDGGEIHRHANVVSINEEDGNIQYATTADGTRYYGKHFISAVHPEVLFSLTDTRQLRPAFRQRVSSLPHTPPAVMLNIVLAPGTVPFRNYNLYWHPSCQSFARSTPSGIQWPDTQAFFFTQDASNPPFADTVTILAYTDDSLFQTWKGSHNTIGIGTERDADYDALKHRITEGILQMALQRMPELAGNITATSLATPLTYRDYTGTPHGSLYGPLKDVDRPAQTNLAIRTKIPNLLLTGQNVNMHGVMGVSITAVATCAELLGLEYLLGKIKSA